MLGGSAEGGVVHQLLTIDAAFRLSFGRSKYMDNLVKIASDESEEEGGIESFTKDLLSTRRDELKAFAIALRNEPFIAFVGTKDGNEAFSELIKLAVDAYGVSQSDLAKAIDASAGTVSRWIGGTSLPPGYARKSIVEALALLIEHDLDL
jgi:ribosome-binding protein aMBF1 (putative translation factor)